MLRIISDSNNIEVLLPAVSDFSDGAVVAQRCSAAKIADRVYNSVQASHAANFQAFGAKKLALCVFCFGNTVRHNYQSVARLHPVFRGTELGYRDQPNWQVAVFQQGCAGPI